MSIMFAAGIPFFPTSAWLVGEQEGFTEFPQGPGSCVSVYSYSDNFPSEGKWLRVLGSKNVCPRLSPSSGTENQIDMRQINKRRSNVLGYLRGIHTDMEILKTVRSDAVYLSS